MTRRRRCWQIIGPQMLLVWAVLALGGCGGGDASFAKSDLATIVRGAPDTPKGWKFQAAASGPQSVDQMASGLQMDVATLNEMGFVAARAATFSGKRQAAASAGAALFGSEQGARDFAEDRREWAEARIAAGQSKRIDGAGLGEEDLALSHSGDLRGDVYLWRVDNLVLSVATVGSVDNTAIVEQLDERAAAAR